MRKGIRKIVAVCFLGLAAQAMGTIDSEGSDHMIAPGSCHCHLHALVAYLKETAQLEGSMLVVEWRLDGSVVLHREDFTQRLWCDGEALHIDFSDTWPEAPEK